MWRKAAEHRTLLVPEAAAAPAAAAATHQPVASPSDASAKAASAEAAAADGANAAAHLWQRLAAADLLAHPKWQPAAVAAVATIWQQASTYGTLLLLPALMSWFASHTASAESRAALVAAAAKQSPRRWRSLKAEPADCLPCREPGSFVTNALGRLQRAALWAAYAFVAVHWLWEDTAGGQRWLSPEGHSGGGGGGGSSTCPSEAATLGDAWGLARRWAGHMTTGVAGQGPADQTQSS